MVITTDVIKISQHTTHSENGKVAQHTPMDMPDCLAEDFKMNQLGSDGGPYLVEVPVVRKPTYVIRKEEKESLQKEIEQLQIKIKAFEDAERERLQGELQQQLQRSQVWSMRQQQLSLVNIQSAVSDYVSTQDSLPYEGSIRLGTDFNQRRELLLATKHRTLEAWLAYYTARTRFLDPFRQISETSRFSLDSGDYCALQLDQTPLFGTKLTVRQVIDTIVANHSSIDIRITEAFNDITTGDEIDYDIEGARQTRFISRLACGVDAEMNNINFHQYFEHIGHDLGGGGPVGVFSTIPVDQDDQYPYQSSDRVRLNISGVVVIREFKRIRRNTSTGAEEEESVIVVTQLGMYKICRPEMLIPQTVEHRLREQLGQWTNVMISAVLDLIQVQYGSKS